MDATRPRREISLGFTDESVREGAHICYLFDDDAERLRVIARYLQSGLLAREKVLYLTDSAPPASLAHQLTTLGVDTASAGEALVLDDAASAYCPSGSFDGSVMLDVVRDFYRAALARGYPGARGTGEMSWCLVEGRADLDEVMDYEANLNLLLRSHPYTACCQYDVRRFDGQAILDVLSVHPLAIVRGQVVHNPYFVDPAAFLARSHRHRDA